MIMSGNQRGIKLKFIKKQSTYHGKTLDPVPHSCPDCFLLYTHTSQYPPAENSESPE